MRLGDAEAAGGGARLDGEQRVWRPVAAEARQGRTGIGGVAGERRRSKAEVNSGSSRQRDVLGVVGGVSDVDRELEAFSRVRVGVHHFPHRAASSVAEVDFSNRYAAAVRTVVRGGGGREDARRGGVAVGRAGGEGRSP